MIGLILKVTILCVGALLALGLMRRSSAALRHLVGASALIGTLLLPLSMLAPASAGIRVPIPVFRFVITAEHAGAARSYLFWLVALWAAGAMVLLLRLAVGHWRIRSIVHAAEPSNHAFLADVSVPMAAGLLTPVILLPRSFPSWPPAQQSAALRHEQAHIDRLDLRINFAIHAACALYWFHPLVWMIARQTRHDQETACDDAVLTGGMEPVSYAEALTATARQFTPTSLPGCQMLTHQTLKDRITRLFDTTLPRTVAASSVRRTAVAAVVVLAVLGVLHAQQEQDRDASPARHEKIYKANESGVTSPRLVSKIEPAYTEEARAAKIEGTVHVTLIVDVDGKATEVNVVTAPDPGLAANAVAAIEQWTFEPATLNGEPVPVSANIEVNFKLQ